VKDLIEYLDTGGDPVISVHTKPISGYANKNPEEAFCEAIGLLVAFGPRTVDEQVQSWLKEIVPSLRIASAKTFIFDASVNRGVCMNRKAIASELVRLAKELVADELPEKFKKGDKVRLKPAELNGYLTSIQPVLKRDGVVKYYRDGTFSGSRSVIVEWIPKTSRGRPEIHAITENHLELI
jgi:hypothetical protein